MNECIYVPQAISRIYLIISYFGRRKTFIGSEIILSCMVNLFQVIDILDSQSAEREAYKKLMSATLIYLKRIKAPEKDIDMVRTWFNHNWDQQKTLGEIFRLVNILFLDENMLIDALPLKLKKDVLIDVHYQTLSKVSLFKDCERTMIFDLIGKLKPVLFLPGALICKKVKFYCIFHFY